MSLRKTLIIMAIAVIPSAVWAATIRTAVTSAFTDVSSAVAAASDGDTVTIPAGSATWSSTLTITKAITLQGAGSTLTIITASNPSSTVLINLTPGSDKPQRITGIGFVGGRHINVNGSTNGSYCLTQIRIDHNSFSSTKADCMWVTGWVESLIDHNSFLNVQRGIMVIGDDNYSWSRPIAAGTSHALFIEDNSFVTDNNTTGMMDHQIYHQGGGRSVIRYNTFDGTAFSNGDYYAIDSHGNQPYVATGTGYFRGQPIVEVYNNTIMFHHSWCPTQFRSGSVLFHDNTFKYTSSISSWTQLWEEESWRWSPVRTVWPAQDQIANSFFWNNTVNGVTVTSLDLNMASDAAFVQKDRDYFMHAPAASGGYTYYTGSRTGGSQTAPTDGTTYSVDGLGDNGNTAFSATGANAYFPYTPYTYPHPLQKSGTTGPAPAAPTGLRLQ